MDLKKRPGQASLTYDEGNALHQPVDNLTFFIGHDHFGYSIDKKIGEKKVKNKNLGYFLLQQKPVLSQIYICSLRRF
jgi:hypothetical protein